MDGVLCDSIWASACTCFSCPCFYPIWLFTNVMEECTCAPRSRLLKRVNVQFHPFSTQGCPVTRTTILSLALKIQSSHMTVYHLLFEQLAVTDHGLQTFAIHHLARHMRRCQEACHRILPHHLSISPTLSMPSSLSMRLPASFIDLHKLHLLMHNNVLHMLSPSLINQAKMHAKG